MDASVGVRDRVIVVMQDDGLTRDVEGAMLFKERFLNEEDIDQVFNEHTLCLVLIGEV